MDVLLNCSFGSCSGFLGLLLLHRTCLLPALPLEILQVGSAICCLSGRQGRTGNMINSFCLEILAGMPGHQVIQMLDKGYRLPQPETCPKALYELMLKCWSTEPSERPTFEALYCQLEDYFDNDSYMDNRATIKWTPRQGRRRKCKWMWLKGNQFNPRWGTGCEDKEEW